MNIYRPPRRPAASKGARGRGGRVPYGWRKRRQSLGFRGEPGQGLSRVPGAQGGYVDPETHTDEEMAEALASAIAGWPYLYNPELRGTGQFGSRIPGPQEMGRRRYYSMDPSGRDMLTSYLESGLLMPSGEYTSSIAEDWLRQMQRSWIPGLEGAKKAVSYAF